ncbi:hypothetical protein R83H12_03169 [Fibrobacteria bacterium R8-3-H12]
MRISDNSMDRTGLLLMDDLWQKTNKYSNKSNIMDDFAASSTPAFNKAMAAKPDWDYGIPSKDTAMSEEEFEEAIKELALKVAEKGAALGNAAEGRTAYRFEEAKLMTKYLSTVSPDRKTAYENNSYQELMVYANGSWTTKFTPDELTRSAKFYEIFNNTIKEYEAENGQIPAGSKSSNPYKDLLAEYKGYNFLNAWA